VTARDWDCIISSAREYLPPPFSSSQLYGLKAKIMEEHVEDDRWDDSNRTEWRSLGLTDPIKKVEVSYLKTSPVHRVQRL